VRRWKIAAVVVATVVLALGGAILGLLVRAGALRHIQPHFEGTCVRVEGAPGPEDLTFHPDGTAVWISSFDRAAASRGEEVTGALLRYHPATGELEDVTPSQPRPFHPHGLSLSRSPDGHHSLFVVNHPEAGAHAIEIFDLTPAGGLEHRRTVVDPALVSPNDVVAVGSDQFYASNDHGGATSVTRRLEETLALPWGNLVYFDGEQARVVHQGTGYANGLAVTSDGRTLYAAETTGQAILVFARDPATGSLVQRHRERLRTGLDNIELAADGSLWVASHPNTLAFMQHASDPTRPAPSQVLHLVPGERGFQVEEVLLDDGSILSAASTAAVHGDTMVLGAVFAPHFAVCTMAAGGAR